MVLISSNVKFHRPKFISHQAPSDHSPPQNQYNQHPVCCQIQANHKCSSFPRGIDQTFLQYQLIVEDAMKAEQLHSANQGFLSKILKVQTRGNETRVLGPTNSRLIVQQNPLAPSDQEVLQEMDASNERITRPQTRNPTGATTEDYVDLPRVNFMQLSGSSGKERKNSQVMIDMAVAEEDSNTHLHSPKAQSEQSQEEVQQNGEYAQWNIHKINIIPSRNNYLKEENYDYLSIPSYRNTKEQSLAVSRETDRSRSRSREKDRKKSEKDRNEERRLFKERERRERERNIQIVSGFLSGKASVIWLFILGKDIKEEDMKQVQELYKNHLENDYEVPVCRSYAQAQKFLKIHSCFFKVVADIESSQKLIEQSPNHKNIIAIYIYNPNGERGINKSFQLKRATKKIKGFFMDLSAAAKQATEQIENEPRFIQVEDELEQERTKLRFPSFILLTGYDNTEVTAYRLSLYGSLKLRDRRERTQYLKEFTDMVELRYAEVAKELANLEQYKQIDHFQQGGQKKSREILSFYVRETFYYVLVNSILRLSRSSEQFRPCTIPFSETYHAIKHYYSRFREESGKRTKRIVTYRGSKLRNNDVKSLQIGSYIQLLGFTSTSLKRSEAQKFMDNDSYLIEIIVENNAETEEEMVYDHGFVEINRYGLANQAYKNEQEVLFNSLNVFRVVQLDLSSAVRKITLRYGAIFDLLRAKPEDLSPHERAVIANYQYCAKTYGQIEDDGDVLLLAQEHGRCVDYYQAKIDQGEINYKVFGKIANAQYQNGDLEEAYNNALRSLQELSKEPDKNAKEVYTNYSRYEKNKAIFQAKEDIVHFRATIERYVKILGQDWLAQTKLFKERAEKSMKNGDLEGCHNDLLKCKEILREKQESFEKRRKEIGRRYMLRSFCCMCSRTATVQLQQQRELQLLKIEEDEVDFQHRKEEIHELSFEIESLFMQLAEKTGNKAMGLQAKQTALLHFNSMSKKNETQSPIVVAKHLAMQASIIQDRDNVNHQQFEQLMESAIKEVKKQDPFHQHLGVYHNVLGTKRHAVAKRKLLLQPVRKDSQQEKRPRSNSGDGHLQDYINMRNEEHSQNLLPQTAKYSYEKHQEAYEKSKESYCAAAENIAYNKGSEHPEYLSVRNNITQLDYDFSRLKESQQTAEQSLELRVTSNHSQGAKCLLLMGKVCLAKGQLKRAFKHIQRAFETLRSALVKVDSKQYNNVFMGHPYYMEISIQKAKVFNRQLRHDLALKQLQIARKIAKLKVEQLHSKVLLATVYEQQAAVLICLGETVSFQQYLNKAISIRAGQMGKFNIPNAISYSNLFKYLRGLNDPQDALSYHHQAVEIFSRFPSDHPHAWIIHLSNGLHFFEKGDREKFMEEMQYCLRVAGKRYSANHISVLKVMLQYGKMLASLEQPGRAIEVLLQLEADLQESLRESMRGEKLEKEMDDEKIPLRKSLYNELKQLYSRGKQGQEGSVAQLKRCELRMKDFEHLATTDKLIKSAHSIIK